MQANTLAKLPLSIQTFAKLREGGFAYVDKTPLALDLANSAGMYYDTTLIFFQLVGFCSNDCDLPVEQLDNALWVN